jgi:hypothetical protein
MDVDLINVQPGTFHGHDGKQRLAKWELFRDWLEGCLVGQPTLSGY